VQLPSAFRKVRRKGAQVAVVGGKSPVQLGHQASDGRRLVDEDDIPARFGKIQGRLDAPDAAPDDE
jgi:hypothetical protein